MLWVKIMKLDRKELKKRVDELSRAHTNCNFYEEAALLLEKIQNADDAEGLGKIIKELREMRNFEINQNYDPWMEELLDALEVDDNE